MPESVSIALSSLRRMMPPRVAARRIAAALAAVLMLGLAGAAVAAERGYSITDFDRIRVEGPFAVTVRVGPASAARARGTTAALDRVSIDTSNRQLVIRADHQAWGGAFPGDDADKRVTIELSTPALRAVAVIGTGSVAIDRAGGLALDLSVGGPGRIEVGAIDADRLGLAVSGAGMLKAAGRAKQARLMLQGSGAIAAADLMADDAVVSAAGSGTVDLAARRSAKVQSAGSGAVTISGSADCTVSQAGTGEVRCGKGR